jgi:ABC-type sugar transport system ATPase subunit
MRDDGVMTETTATAPLAGTVLDVRGVSKSFGGTHALRDVDLALRAGETVGIVGENGAGKSTLMKIIAGVYAAFDGELIVHGKPRAFRSVKDAEAAGIVLVPQELQVAPNLSIAENMFMGILPGRRGFVDERALYQHARDRLRFFDIHASPDARMATLAPSEQRLVTIAAALSKSARIIILDEPTAALTEEEATRLFAHVRRVHDEGVSCLYITHRLDEVERIADRVVVMRNGRVVEHLDSARGRRAEIVRAMIGRDPEPSAARPPRGAGEPGLSVAGLTVHDANGSLRPRATDIAFTVHRGEILGLFGLVGAGRTEMARALFGSWPGRVEGEVRIGERRHRPASPRDAIASGLAMLTEDRKQTGIIEGQTVTANISAASLGDVSGRMFIDERREHGRAERFIRDLDVRPKRGDLAIEALSGGNQQKVLLARWIATKPSVLILDEPTLGVDIGARFELYRLIRALADDGCAILMISSDINEVLDECDRILVMYKGRLTGEFGRDAQRHAIMAAATGEPA